MTVEILVVAAQIERTSVLGRKVTGVTDVQSPLRKGPVLDKGKIPGKTIAVGTAASKTSPGAKALKKLGSSKTSLPPGRSRASRREKRSESGDENILKSVVLSYGRPNECFALVLRSSDRLQGP